MEARILRQLRPDQLRDVAIPGPGVHQKERKSVQQRNILILVSVAAPFTILRAGT